MVGEVSHHSIPLSPLCCSYLAYALPSIGSPPCLRDFNYWYGFLLGLALMDELSGVGGCKGPYAPIGPLLACTCGTQHWDAMQYTYNYACSRTVHTLHIRVVTFGGKQCWFFLMNKLTFNTGSWCMLQEADTAMVKCHPTST